MLKWQAQATIGRGRPLCAEFAKVADGIAASLRQFHVSAIYLADSEKKSFRISRVSNVSSEIHSHRDQPSSHPLRKITGIDARSFGEALGSTDPSGTRQTLVRPPSKLSGGFHGHGGLKGGRGQTSSAARDRGPPVRRVGSNFTTRGRGGLAGGGFRGRGRGKRGRGGGRRRVDAAFSKDGEHGIKYTPEELEYLSAREAAEKPQPVPYKPQEVTLASLTPYAPQIPINPIGASSIIDSRLRQLASRPPDTYTRIETLTTRLLQGHPTFFESESERSEVLRAATTQLGRKKGTVELEGMVDAERREVEERLLRGEYTMLEDRGEKKGVLKDVGRLAGRNESYLERDVGKVVERVGALVPSKPAALRRAGGVARGRS